jgi:hypothetical protein
MSTIMPFQPDPNVIVHGVLVLNADVGIGGENAHCS